MTINADSDTKRMSICLAALVVWSVSCDTSITFPIIRHPGGQELFKILPHQPVSGHPPQ